MKLKEILTNKWAWAGVILILIWYMYPSIYEISHDTGENYYCKAFSSCSLNKALMNFDYFSSHLTSDFMGIPNWIATTGIIIIGFIIGLIANKLWRRFR